ncbi:MAG: hypothetical protein K6B45_04570 [Bacteroidaceae bacterium]|nr:hypothetical protein [Bacteroidaceae bacterium]
MKKKLLFLLGGAFLGGLFSLNVSAQTDVTSTYLTNADFSQGTPITVGVCTYAKDTQSNGTEFSQLVAVDGWDIVENGDARAGGLVAFGSGVWIGGPGYTAPATNSDGDATGNILGLVGVWTGLAQYTQSVTLPAGTYTLVLGVYNSVGGTEAFAKNLIGFIEDGGTEHLATTTQYGVNTWKYEFISFTLDAETKGKISLGYKSTDQGSGKMPHLFLSGIQLFDGALDAEAYEAAKEAARNAKELAANKEKLAGCSYANPSEDLLVNGSFDTADQGWTLTNMGYQKNGERSTRYVEKWDQNPLTGTGSAAQTIKNYPAGAYIFTATVHTNKTETGGATLKVNDASEPVSGSWKEYKVVYNLAADGNVTVAFEYNNLASNWVAIDGASLVYGGDYEAYVTAAHKGDWDAALAAANEALASDDYKNVVGEEKTALEAEVAKAEPTTADGYDAATAALNDARRTFTDAKPSYDALADANGYVEAAGTLKYADQTKKPAASGTATSAADAVSKAAATMTAVRVYYESHAAAEAVAKAVDKTAVITNATDPTNNDGWTWEGNKNNPASNEPWTDADGTNTHSYFDGGNWSANAWTTTMKQTIAIPAGKYLLTAKARAATNVTFTLSVGEASVSLPHVGSTGNVFDRGWGDASVEFETEGENVEIMVKATTETIHEWFSISAFRLVQLEEIVVPMATSEDYAALASAIQAAEGNTLGFGAGEYAPYNNVEALATLAAAKAIDPTLDTNTQKSVKAATAALTSAVWTANTADVDAIYNGMFAKVTEGANYPDGWARTNAWGQMQSGLEGDYATAYYNQPGSLKYGETGAYAMPLAANTYYKLTLVYRSHEDNSNNGITVSILNGEEGVSGKVLQGNPSKTEWKKGVVGLKTGAAGNYVLTLANNGNTWISAVSLVKATPESVDITIADNKYATFVAPFDVAVPAGVTASKVMGVTDENELKLEAVETTIPANTPVLLYSESGVNTTVEGVNEALEATYTNGLLTGVYADTEAPVGTYVLQKHGNSVAFYLVADVKPTVGAGRCYLTAPAAGEAPVLRIGGTTNIANVENIEADAVIYDLQGRRVDAPAKGIYVVNGKKVIKN